MKFTENKFTYAPHDIDIAYLLGLYLTDGYVTHGGTKNRSTRFGVTSIDREITERVQAIAKLFFGKDIPITVRHNKYFIASITSVTLCAWLETVTSQKTMLPEFVFYENKAWQLEFLAGVLDGDGWVTFAQNRYETKSGKPPTWYSQIGICGVLENTYLNGIPRLLDILGVRYKIGKTPPRKEGYLWQQRVLINPLSAVESGIYFTTKRKIDKLESIRKYIDSAASND